MKKAMGCVPKKPTKIKAGASVKPGSANVKNVASTKG